ncbi:unnamed protein product [Bursaphelenchus xylophilus]|uniref:Galactosylgalactosylxylosylprotein 3-beta-glucuronosyltransferase n=1 Tax=Bursaphelenchus xylophilus TaxID=6326 RepID=A0A1I7RNH2_BURXY|nr:unnamed protein product [Bursaphelenchus xylophilus]CAG9124012.1 unnamed protein product [Bursaphelenchus xylophilus]
MKDAEVLLERGANVAFFSWSKGFSFGLKACALILVSTLGYVHLSSLSSKGIELIRHDDHTDFSTTSTDQDREYNNTIIVITPTYKRPERLADITMLSQTLMHIPNVFWLVIEDGDYKVEKVENVLKRTGLRYAYVNTTNQGLPCRGWAHRNYAFDWIRANRKHFKSNDVVFFGDDDNAYDLRLFRDYIPNVKVMGAWAVGTSGSTLVESPKVNKEGKLAGWHVMFRPDRKYATDMAGFALNIDVLINSNASFNLHCAGSVPEECFLRQVNVPWSNIQVFGYDQDDVLIWHRKTAAGQYDENFPHNGYFTETLKIQPKSCQRMQPINHISYEEALRLFNKGDN